MEEDKEIKAQCTSCQAIHDAFESWIGNEVNCISCLQNFVVTNYSKSNPTPKQPVPTLQPKTSFNNKLSKWEKKRDSIVFVCVKKMHTVLFVLGIIATVVAIPFFVLNEKKSHAEEYEQAQFEITDYTKRLQETKQERNSLEDDIRKVENTSSNSNIIALKTKALKMERDELTDDLYDFESKLSSAESRSSRQSKEITYVYIMAVGVFVGNIILIILMSYLLSWMAVVYEGMMITIKNGSEQ